MHRLGVSLTVGLALAFLLSIAAPQPAIAAATCDKNQTHNALFGRRQPGDEMVHMDHVKLSSKIFRVVTKDIFYPSRSDKLGNVTFIEVYDQFRNGKGGCTTISSGGIGSSHVSLHLKSQRGNGIDFVLRIYAKTKRR